MTIKKHALSFLVLLIVNVSFAQTKVDSLRSLLESSKGLDKATILSELCWELKFIDTNESMKMCDQSIEWFGKHNMPKERADVIYKKGVLLHIQGKFKKCLEFTDDALDQYKNTMSSAWLSKIWNLKGMSNNNSGYFQEAINAYNKALSLSEIIDDQSLSLHIRGNIANIHYDQGEFKNAINQHKEIAKQWLNSNDSTNYYVSLGHLGECYYRLGEYPEALKIFFEIEAFEKAQNKLFRLANNYNSMGLLYSKLELNQQALEAYNKAVELFEKIGAHRQLGMMSLHLGNHYGRLDDVEKAHEYFEKALVIYDSLGIAKKGSIINNFGELKMQRGEYEKAIEFYLASLEINKKIGVNDLIALNYYNLGKAYTELEDGSIAEKYLLQALDITKELGENYLHQNIIKALAELYDGLKNEAKYKFYKALIETDTKDVFEKNNLIEINRMLVEKMDKEQKSLKKDLSRTQESLYDSQKEVNLLSKKNKWTYLSLLLLLPLFLGWLFLRFRNKNSNTNTNTNQEKEDNAHQELKSELYRKNKQLAILSLESAHNNAFLQNLQKSLSQLSTEIPNNESIKMLAKKLNSNHIEKNSWNKFIVYFNEIHEGFFDRLTKKYPNITNKELRLCALIRLRIPNHESSIILGISTESTHTARYRLRKKLNLKAEENLDQFICEI